VRWAGVDFGTTNSAVAFVDDAGVPVLAQFPGTQVKLAFYEGLAEKCPPRPFICLAFFFQLTVPG